MKSIELVELGEVTIEVTRRGTGQVIILVPGTLGDDRIFTKIIKPLQKHYECITINHPKLDTIEDIMLAYHQLFEELKIQPYCLLGTSVGGWLIQHYATTYPDDIDKIILVETFGDNSRIRSTNLTMFKISKFIPWSLFRWIFLRGVKDSVKRYSSSELLEILTDSVNTLGKTGLRQRLSWSLETVSQPEIPNRIDMKLIHTTDDTVVKMEEFEALKSKYPWAKSAILEEGSHFPYFINTDEFVDEIFQFLL